ncbi:MAG: sialate O-acetylesterase [Verrucomicrobiota bacterium]
MIKPAGPAARVKICLRRTLAASWRLGFLLLGLLLMPMAQAELRLPAVIADHMVLQQGQSNPIWGWDSPGTKIAVTFAGKTYVATTGDDGKWVVNLEAQAANASPQTLTVAGSTTREVQDVLIGEVWLCSGQSNMEMGLGMVENGSEEIAQANYPEIRLLMVANRWTPQPQEDMEGLWKACSPKTVAEGGWNGFSATAYFFGRELHKKLGVPVGLIEPDWGGTRIESWTAPEGFAAVPALKHDYELLELGDPKTAVHQKRLAEFLDGTASWLESARIALTNQTLVSPMPTYPAELMPPHDLQNSTALYNGMIFPVHPYGIRGAIWYQGESNVGEGMLYLERMKALVNGWRQVWNEGAFPFEFVQIAPYNYGNHPQAVPELWEAQAAAAREIPDCGMAVINDIGNVGDIHPKNKQEVGRRLALIALARTYGQPGVVYSGPTFKSLATEGDKLRVNFENAEGGLATRDEKPPSDFEIIDAEDGGFVKATAEIEDTSVLLSAPGVEHPAAARFAWDQTATPNLMNKSGLPAGAFRAGSIPPRDFLKSHVLEAGGYQLVYDLDLGRLGQPIQWQVDNRSRIHGAFDRIAYCVELEDADGRFQAVYVSMDAFTDSLDKIGLPTLQSGAYFQQNVTNLTVVSNVKDIVTGAHLTGGNIEFWPNNYAQNNSANVPNASSATFDFGDQPTDPADGYGCMQVHNHDARQTLFAINHWREGEHADLGIGNAPTGNPDWTFAGNAGQYKSKRLRVLVHCP